MRIVHILAGKPDNRCGVLDYTKKLVEALSQRNGRAECVLVHRWSLKETLRVASAYRQEIVHVQYPSMQMGNAPWWGLLSLFCKHPIVTLHEFRIFSTPRKLYCLPTAAMARQIIFSSDEERRAFLSFYPFAERRSTVIPVGNNIPVLAGGEGERPRRLIYFGQIGENKGLEQVVEAAAELRARRSSIPIAFVGAIVDPASPTVAFVREAAAKYAIDLRLNLTSDEVSKELARSSHAYLPFPDGITDKRGSALACLKHGVAVLTTHSEQTPDWLRVATMHCPAPLDAANFVMAPELPRIDAAVLAEGLAEREWPAIAERHLCLYDDLEAPREAPVRAFSR